MVCVNNIAFIFKNTKVENKKNSKIYKIIFTKSHLVSSSLGLSDIDINNVWHNWKTEIYNQLYGNFVIDVKCYNKAISVYAQLVVIKECIKDPDHVNLYFKYDIPVDYTDTSCYQCKTIQSITLRSKKYTNIQFYYDDTYQYKAI